MNEPTIILIGGPSGAGKTTTGTAIANRLGWASLTVDDLVVAVRAVTTPDSHPTLFPMRLAGGHVAYFTEGPPQRLIDDALRLEELAWPMVETVIRRHLREGAPIVIDWWLHRPATIAALDLDGVAALFLHPDPDLLWERERANTWTAASPDPERMLEHFMARSLWRNELVASEAASIGLPVVDIVAGDSVDLVVDRALAALGIQAR